MSVQGNAGGAGRLVFRLVMLAVLAGVVLYQMNRSSYAPAPNNNGTPANGDVLPVKIDPVERSGSNGGSGAGRELSNNKPLRLRAGVKPNLDALKTPKGGIPAAAYATLNTIWSSGSAPANTIGGRDFGNREQRLPKSDAGGAVLYQEWDVHPLSERNRGPERIVTGDNGTAYYTGDHYSTFNAMADPPK